MSPGLVCVFVSTVLLAGLNGNNASVFIDPCTTSGAGDPAKRGPPHEEQIFR